MGIARPKTLSDLIRLEAQLRITCQTCDRSVVYVAREIIGYFHARGWKTAWEAAATYFRCDGCGKRNARLSPAPIMRRLVPPVPVPTERDHKAEIRRRRS